MSGSGLVGGRRQGWPSNKKGTLLVSGSSWSKKSSASLKMPPSFVETLRKHGDDAEERRGLLVPSLRERLMSHDYGGDEREAESLLTLWLEGIEGGMESILVLVTLQTISGERGAQWEDFMTPQSLRGLLHKLGPAQIDSSIFVRILLFCLTRLVWRVRRHWTETAQAAGPYPDLAILAQSGEGEWMLVQEILSLAERTHRVPCRRQLLTFVHQLFLENSTLIKRLYGERCLTEELGPWAVEMVPSLYVLIDQVLEDVRKTSSYDSWLLRLGAQLALKYPMPRTLELCALILERCRQYGDAAPGSSLRVTVLALEAFPTLMEAAMEYLVVWRQRYAEDLELRPISQEAARQIVAINERVKLPIYSRTMVFGTN